MQEAWGNTNEKETKENKWLGYREKSQLLLDKFGIVKINSNYTVISNIIEA